MLTRCRSAPRIHPTDAEYRFSRVLTATTSCPRVRHRRPPRFSRQPPRSPRLGSTPCSGQPRELAVSAWSSMPRRPRRIDSVHHDHAADHLRLSGKRTSSAPTSPEATSGTHRFRAPDAPGRVLSVDASTSKLPTPRPAIPLKLLNRHEQRPTQITTALPDHASYPDATTPPPCTATVRFP